jgi:hypothetical protein
MACRTSVPGLVKASHKYRGRGLAFLSLTAEPRARAEEFAPATPVPWPCGYGVEREQIARWGAYSAEFLSAGWGTGYEVRPTLYLLGPGGRVLWCDGQARPRHLGDAAELLRRLNGAIDLALAGPKDAP